MPLWEANEIRAKFLRTTRSCSLGTPIQGHIIIALTAVGLMRRVWLGSSRNASPEPQPRLRPRRKQVSAKVGRLLVVRPSAHSYEAEVADFELDAAHSGGHAKGQAQEVFAGSARADGDVFGPEVFDGPQFWLGQDQRPAEDEAAGGLRAGRFRPWLRADCRTWARGSAASARASSTRFCKPYGSVPARRST